MTKQSGSNKSERLKKMLVEVRAFVGNDTIHGSRKQRQQKVFHTDKSMCITSVLEMQTLSLKGCLKTNADYENNLMSLER